MDALRRSIAEEKAIPIWPTKGRKGTEGQGEMLLPIPHKKHKEVVAKPTERASVRQRKAG